MKFRTFYLISLTLAVVLRVGVGKCEWHLASKERLEATCLRALGIKDIYSKC